MKIENHRGPDMQCCKANKYNNWCHGEPLVEYKDEEGNQYCVFHAPQGKKDRDLKNFNMFVFKRIADNRGGNCSFSGAIFEGEIEFSNVSLIVDIDFQEAMFNGATTFIKAIFKGKANFSKAVFRGDVNLHNAVFNGDAYFRSTRFIGATDFMNTDFHDAADFSEAIFDGKLILANAHFAGPLLFTSTTVKGQSLLEHVEFDGYTNFFGSHFYEDAYFGWAKLNGLTWFNEVTFDGEAAFDNSKFNGELECIRTTFNGRVNFRRAEFKDKSYFGDCEFYGDPVNFSMAWFSGRAYFKGTTFYVACTFQNLNITTKMRFEGVDCGRISFLDTDVRQIDFVDCIWPKARRRNILFDEQKLMSKNNEQTPARFKKVENLYRKLKQKYKEEHDEAEASNWHYGEKTMYRLRSKLRRYLPSVTTVYWLSSGYGERPVRAGIVLSMMLIIFSFTLLASGLTLPEGVENVYGITNSDLNNVLSLKSIAASFMNLLKYVTFQKDSYFIPSGWLGEMVRFLAQILVPLQTALFALAVRNRFRR